MAWEPLHAVLARLQSTGLTERSELPTPLEVLDGCGGTVEGLLLTADADGRPGDDFAWCLAVHHPCGFPLARITVPASRARCRWRSQVDSIIAGVALSCWHEPAGSSPPPAVRVDRQQRENDALDEAGVHVLDIEATSPRTPRHQPGGEPSRTSRPHLRRGHWRCQPVGEGRRDTRWTWVRATTVNGTRITTHQVYVLPRGRGDS